MFDAAKRRCTQGNKVDVSSREYFKRAMEGKCTISDILVDALDDSGDLLTLMSVPVRDGEGVETNEQLAFIEEQYADDIQGFYFARPMPINEFLELYDEG